MMRYLRAFAAAAALAALAVTPVAAQSVTPIDCSGSIIAGGTAQNAFANQGALRGFMIANVDATEALWLSITGTAAANAAGSIFLSAADGTKLPTLFIAPPGLNTNKALSVVAATTGHKFTCVRW